MHCIAAGVTIYLLFAPLGSAQNSQPSSLSARYNRLSCAVVQLLSTRDQNSTESGTGVFINRSGDVLTAAHVVLNINGLERQGETNTDISTDLAYRSNIRLIRPGMSPTPLTLPALSAGDRVRAQSDLAILHTGIKTPCALKMAPVDHARIGDHVIVIGYPLFSNVKTLYTGNISSREPNPHIPVGVVNGIPVYADYNAIKFQMPVTAAVSGAPLIADDDTVIGVVTESTLLWSGELNALLAIYESRKEGFKALPSDQLEPGKVDTQRLLALLAYLVQNSLSTGIGVAVPIQAMVPSNTTAPNR